MKILQFLKELQKVKLRIIKMLRTTLLLTLISISFIKTINTNSSEAKNGIPTSYMDFDSGHENMIYGQQSTGRTSGILMNDGSIMDFELMSPHKMSNGSYRKDTLSKPKYTAYDVTEEMIEEGIVTPEDVEAEVAKVAEAELDAESVALAAGTDTKSAYCKYDSSGALIKETSAPHCKLSETAQIKISAPVRSARFNRIGRFGGVYLYPEVSSCSNCSAVAVAESCMVSCRRSRLRPILDVVMTINRRPRIQYVRPISTFDCSDDDSDEVVIASSQMKPTYVRTYPSRYSTPVRSSNVYAPSYYTSPRYSTTPRVYRSSPSRKYYRSPYTTYRPTSRDYTYTIDY